MKIIDMRSDTVTKPTEAMRRAMMEAEVGDDVYGDDPTVNTLERTAASLLGKKAAVFVPTGTMGNQASVMAHTRPGDELIASSQCHILQNEVGGVARLSGVSTAITLNSSLTPQDIHNLVRPGTNAHYPRSSLVCLENAVGNGDVIGLAQMKALYETAKQYKLKVHLDGARLFNAAAALGVEAREIAAYTDSIMFCVSKGLCAPVGSLVCGDDDFISELRRCRKVLGGGMRQAGVLAAPALVALTEMAKRLTEDHDNARHLEFLLMELPELEVNIGAINMVFWRPLKEGFKEDFYLSFMSSKGFKLNGSVAGLHRLVTHNDISRDDVEHFAACLKECLHKMQ